MTRTIYAAIAALFLTTLPGTLNAQQTPVPPAEVPHASPSAPQGEPDGDWDWRRWPDQMREWMMTQDWDPRHMMEWRGNRGPGVMWGNGPPMSSGMMPMVMMAMMDTDENGSLSASEYENAGLQRYGVSFEQSDADADGRTTKAEYLELKQKSSVKKRRSSANGQRSSAKRQNSGWKKQRNSTEKWQKKGVKKTRKGGRNYLKAWPT